MLRIFILRAVQSILLKSGAIDAVDRVAPDIVADASGVLAYAATRSILQVENQQRLWPLANHDALPGLPNRMLLWDRLKQVLARMRRQGKRLAVMFLDLDDFKRVNDAHGHAVGDQLLKFVAECLQA